MNIKQLMVTFFIALLAGGEIGARVLTDKFVYSQGEKVVFTFDGKSEGKTIILKYLSKKGEPVLVEIGGEPFVWEVPSEFTPAAVGVYQKEEGQLTYSSYFGIRIFTDPAGSFFSPIALFNSYLICKDAVCALLLDG